MIFASHEKIEDTLSDGAWSVEKKRPAPRGRAAVMAGKSNKAGKTDPSWYNNVGREACIQGFPAF